MFIYFRKDNGYFVKKSDKENLTFKNKTNFYGEYKTTDQEIIDNFLQYKMVDGIPEKHESEEEKKEKRKNKHINDFSQMLIDDGFTGKLDKDIDIQEIITHLKSKRSSLLQSEVNERIFFEIELNGLMIASILKGHKL